MASIPPHFLCPITHDIMRDPVVLQDGSTYEKAAIEEYFRECRHRRTPIKSPLTNVALPSPPTLTPNRGLRDAIEDFMAQWPRILQLEETAARHEIIATCDAELETLARRHRLYQQLLFRDHGTMSVANNDVCDRVRKANLIDGAHRWLCSKLSVGRFMAALFDGRGTMTYDNGDVYKGAWKDASRVGPGTLKYANGDVYIGEWKENKKEGRGTFRWPYGREYVGRFKAEMRDGQGTYRWPSGSVYEGEWKENQKHGQGTMKFANRDVCDEDEMGSNCWPSGSVYTGAWKDGEMEGHGTMKYANGHVYDGQWKDEKKEGQGMYRWPSGQVYTGTWKSNMMNGQGTMKFANGNVCAAVWKKDDLTSSAKWKFAGFGAFLASYSTTHERPL